MKLLKFLFLSAIVVFLFSSCDTNKEYSVNITSLYVLGNSVYLNAEVSEDLTTASIQSAELEIYNSNQLITSYSLPVSSFASDQFNFSDNFDLTALSGSMDKIAVDCYSGKITVELKKETVESPLYTPVVAPPEAYGGSKSEEVRRIVMGNDGNLVIVGNSESGDYDFANSQGYGPIFAMKITPEGQILWVQKYGSLYDVSALDLVKVNGGYVVVGDFDGKPWLFKIDESGNQVWSHGYNDESYGFSKGTATDDGGVVVAGTYIGSSDVKGFYMKVDSYGQVVWQEVYGDNDVGLNIKQLSTGDYLGIAYNYMLTEPVVVHFNSYGELTWRNVYSEYKRIYYDFQEIGSSKFIFVGMATDYKRGIVAIGDMYSIDQTRYIEGYTKITQIKPFYDGFLISGILTSLYCVSKIDMFGNELSYFILPVQFYDDSYATPTFDFYGNQIFVSDETNFGLRLMRGLDDIFVAKFSYASFIPADQYK